MVMFDDGTIRDLFLKVCARTEEEVTEGSACAARVGIPEVVPTQAVVDGDPAADCPGVLDKGAVRDAGSIPVVLRLLSGDRIVRHSRFGIDVVGGEVQQAVELEGRLIVRSCE